MTSHYDLIFTFAGAASGIDWLLLKAQAQVESSLRANAVSPAGAIGLMQIMPGTAKDLGVSIPALLRDPLINVGIGVRYLLRMRALSAKWFSDPDEQHKCALACYNGGPGYVIKAQQLAVRHFPAKPLQKWDNMRPFLAHPECRLKSGRRPDYKQIWNYVAKVWTIYEGLCA